MLILIILFLLSKTENYMSLSSFYQHKDNQKLSKFLGKVFKRLLYLNEYKTKCENKNTTNEYRYFVESNYVGVKRLFVMIYPKQSGSVKRFNGKKYYLPKVIIKYYNIIVNRKNFYDPSIDSDVKRYEETRKLTAGKGEDYTAGCLLDYEYIKNHYKL